MDSSPRIGKAILAAILTWLVPGAGYAVTRQWWRWAVTGGTIVVLFVMGLWIGGIRCIDVPGYDPHGQVILIDGVPVMTVAPMSEILNKPLFIGQVFAGPMHLACVSWSLDAARADLTRAHGRLPEIAALYLAVAGMLNLMVMVDSAARSAREEAKP